MENFFSLDGKFFRFINKFTSLIALNFYSLLHPFLSLQSGYPFTPFIKQI